MLEPWAWQHKKWKKWPYFYLFETRHLNGADVALAASDLEARNLRAYARRTRVKTIPLALPQDVPPEYDAARYELGWKPHETVLVYLSRVHEKKGLHVLLKALSCISEPSHTRLVVVGDGPVDYIRRLSDFEASNASHLPQIDWEGAVWGDRKWRYLQGADLFCLPTHSENFGLVVLEAAQVGTPILTTTSTPWAFLESWDAGIIVEPTVEAVHDGLMRFFRTFAWSAEKREALAARIRRRFDLEKVGAQYIDTYQSLTHT
jgi:glycosyltransferase involved in cell wall biosynthesis